MDYPLPLHPIPFELMFKNSKKVKAIDTYTRENMNTHKCPDCGGDGEHVTSHRYRCTTCRGKGLLSDKEYHDFLTKQKEESLRNELINKVRYKLYHLSDKQLEEILLLEELK